MANIEYPVKGATLQIKDNGTTVTLAVSQAGEISLDFSVSEARGLESIKRANEVIDNVTIRVRLGNLSWDGQVIGFVMGTSSANKDVDGALKTGYTMYKIASSGFTTPKLTIYGTFTDGTNEFAFKATNFVPDILAFPWGAEGFLPRNLSGTARDAVVHGPSPA